MDEIDTVAQGSVPSPGTGRVVSCELAFWVAEPAESVLQVTASDSAGSLTTERFEARSEGDALAAAELRGPHGTRSHVLHAPPGRLRVPTGPRSTRRAPAGRRRRPPPTGPSCWRPTRGSSTCDRAATAPPTIWWASRWPNSGWSRRSGPGCRTSPTGSAVGSATWPARARCTTRPNTPCSPAWGPAALRPPGRGPVPGGGHPGPVRIGLRPGPVPHGLPRRVRGHGGRVLVRLRRHRPGPPSGHGAHRHRARRGRCRLRLRGGGHRHPRVPRGDATVDDVLPTDDRAGRFQLA